MEERVLAYDSRGIQSIMVEKTWLQIGKLRWPEQEAMSHPHVESEGLRIPVLISLSLSYIVEAPTPGDGSSHSTQASHFNNLIKIIFP